MLATERIEVAEQPTVLPAMPLSKMQITAGNPVARGQIVGQTSDKTVSSGYWSCEAGEFDWEYTWDEFMLILSGEAIVTDVSGKTHEIHAGQTAFFPRGIKTHWRIVRPMRKFFVVRTSHPL
ncbi:MAG: cupin domain-containing protein [Phycisphaeraceae bacterium]|nr:cupin domain-containing protein [Phycisphaeraceae bacterium]